MASQNKKVEFFKYSNRVVLKSILCRDDKGIGSVGERVVVGGWVESCKEKAEAVVAMTGVTCLELVVSRVPILRNISRLFINKGGSANGDKVERRREARTLPFVGYLRINDGSCVANLQVVVDSSLYPLGQITHVGTSILVEGVIEKLSAPTKHVVELKAEKILHVGSVDLDKYPLGNTRDSLDFIRSYPHLRPRTSTVASTTRIRSSLFHATHLFFQCNGFLHVHMPIITASSDTTSNIKNFQITTLLSKQDDTIVNDKEDINVEVVRAAINEKRTRIEELKRSDSNKEVLIDALRDLQKANELVLLLEKQTKKEIISLKDRVLDFSKDYFSHPVYLSASFGLHLESYACALCSVYSFGPTFQANEKLVEQWMIEVALAFAELEDVMSCAEDCLKFLCHRFLESCPDDLKLLMKRVAHNCIDNLKSTISYPFARITYTEALEILKKAENRKFEAQVEWGIGLSREHESYLADDYFKQPIIIYEYPKEVKPFYVRIREDGRTVFAFDIVAPKVGVLIRGSQKEERGNKITTRLKEAGLAQEQYEWYIDLRRHGTVKHSGFNLSFEKMVMFATGVEDIRDVIPFPRTRGYANV